MFYDLIIHPSRIEFFHRIFSPEKNDFTEKKLGSSDLDFKFDPNMLDKGDHYTTFKQAVKELIDPYRNEFNSINVIIGNSFFQTKFITCDQHKADFPEYINWEAFQMATDQPENYRVGHLFLEHDRKLLIILVRKKVYDYFTTLMHELYFGQVECKLGCACPLPNFKEITVYADKQLLKPFKPAAQEYSSPSHVSDDTLSAPVRAARSAAFIFVLLFLFLLSVSVALVYFAPDFTRNKLEQLTSFIPSSDKVQPEQPNQPVTTTKETVTDLAVNSTQIPADSSSADTTAVAAPPVKTDSVKANITQAAIPIKEQPVNEKPVIEKPKKKLPEEQPAKTPVAVVDPSLDPHPVFWEYLIAVSEVKADSIVFLNGTGNGELNFYSFEDSILKKAKDISSRRSYKTTSSGIILNVKDDSFFFTNSRKRSNYNRFLEVKNNLGIKSRAEFPNVFRFPSIDKLHEFFKGLSTNNVGFKKFVIEHSDEFITFTVYFG
jgi:hypothetical protein